ncbi:hypothetical protein HYX13_02740 [Candidatus Woesearchaeota archaeon]|nr:hypothetical protein [Candidatus Woesearchaeota archaeon]
MWAGGEIGASVTAQRYENAGREALYSAILATGDMDYKTAKEYLALSQNYYGEALWWNEAVDKFGLYSRVLQWSGKEESTPEGLEVLFGLQKLLEVVAPEDELEEENLESETEKSI